MPGSTRRETRQEKTSRFRIERLVERALGRYMDHVIRRFESVEDAIMQLKARGIAEISAEVFAGERAQIESRRRDLLNLLNALYDAQIVTPTQIQQAIERRRN